MLVILILRIDYLAAITNTLPVELLTFQAQPLGNYNVELSWETCTERSNDYFTLYRSYDGFFWEDIGQVEGCGNSYICRRYTFIDSGVSGDIYYKLSQTDFDGTTDTLAYAVVFSGSKNEPCESLFYPNPVSSYLVFNNENMSGEHILIIDTEGRILVDKLLQGNKLYVGNLECGLYFLKLKGMQPVPMLKK